MSMVNLYIIDDRSAIHSIIHWRAAKEAVEGFISGKCQELYCSGVQSFKKARSLFPYDAGLIVIEKRLNLVTNLSTAFNLMAKGEEWGVSNIHMNNNRDKCRVIDISGFESLSEVKYAALCVAVRNRLDCDILDESWVCFFKGLT